ncbi:MAG: hypothetical protein J6Q39_08130 [Bacteroidales bacterium]|nr:hypothetical protein [Bacteroidales bacterium]
MAETPKNPVILDSFDKKHLQQIAALENKVAAIYAELCKEVGIVGTLFGSKVDLEKVFKLSDYPEINKKVDQIITTLHDRLGSAIVDGVTAQWQLANEKNDDLVRKVFGKDLDNLTEDQITRYFTSNQSALDAFLKRKDKGLGLSQKVWKYAKEAKVDIESALELGIKTGQSASSIARDLKQYLKEPDKLFRRVRDKDGKLHLSKAAQAYHPGQGVYRSSYKNALRLAVTEANMAYRASDYERVQNFDFVVGIEVRLSNNHTLNGQPFYDICDELKGKYPKDFKFRGWHPFCRCHAITILKTREELMADNQRILDGQEPTEDSVNSVNDLPDNFKSWAVKNKSRILAADEKGTLPYFITDNPYSVNSAIGQPLASVKVPLWYAHNAQVKEVQGKLKEIKQWSYEHPKSKKIVGLINDTDAAISNGAAIEDILARFEAANKEYKGKLWEAEYVAKKKAEAAKKPTALDIAKKRHESRTQEQIGKIRVEWGKRTIRQLNQAIDDGLLPQEVFGKTGDMYMMLKEGDFGAFNKAVSPLQKAVARHKARTPDVKKAIQDAWDFRKEAILKDEQFLSTLIPNVKDWKKQFGTKKLHEVYDAVEKKLQQINALPLDQQVKALNKEILYVSDATYLKAHTIYPTWEVAQAAYYKQLGIVQYKIGIKGVQDTLNPINAWLANHPKVKKLSGMVDEVKDLINSGADMSEINLKMSAINTEYKNKLYEEQYAARLKARKAYSSAGAQDRGVDRLYKGGDPYTEAEKAELFKRELDIIDKIFSGQRITSWDIEKYHDYALQLSEKYYKKQVSVYSADEIAEFQRIIKKYTTHRRTNPRIIWGADIGGVYAEGSFKWQKLMDYMPELTGLTPAEVSVVKRFTNGSTFSNCYNLYKESPYWRQKFLGKMRKLDTLSDMKKQFELIEDWSQSANYVLDRMVRYNGITFRGLDSGGGPEVRAAISKAFNSGKPWVNNASCSTSIKHSVAESFDGDTILIIHNKTGAWIHPISDYSHEYEVMTKRGAKYRVIKPPTYTNGRWYAELEEII